MKVWQFNLCAFPIIAAVRGFVLQCLWGWFAVPFGLPSISLVHALGLALLIWVAIGVRRPSTIFDSSLQDEARDFAFSCAMAVYILALGLVLKWLMP